MGRTAIPNHTLWKRHQAAQSGTEIKCIPRLFEDAKGTSALSLRQSTSDGGLGVFFLKSCHERRSYNDIGKNQAIAYPERTVFGFGQVSSKNVLQVVTNDENVSTGNSQFACAVSY
jgi:hypothetical protein